MNTELIKHIELLIGGIGVILGVFFSVFLFITRKKQPKANLFLSIYLAAFSLRIGKSLFHNSFQINPTLRTFFLTMLLCVGPSLWLYTLYTIEPSKKKQLNDSTHFLAFFILVSICWTIPNNGSMIFAMFYDFLTFHMFGYTLFSLLWLTKNNRTNETEKKVRTWLVSFLTINLVIIILYFLISKLIIPFYLGLSFLFSLLIIYFSFWALKNPILFKVQEEKYKNSTITSTEAFELISSLKMLMKLKKPYLDPTLTLTQLGEELEVSSKELSQAINQIESCNYSQFIAKYRIEEVQKLLKSSSHTKFTIASIAYDCGFSSISSFNTAFKKHTGITASEYRKLQKTE